ncbi:MAG: LysM peptidoglycan-binding domain-containing protein [Anaerolineaceae bacterium]|nr:LysM peptidoglycan-binding domain-containing protein [Anaerolineaceae bacterium]
MPRKIILLLLALVLLVPQPVSAQTTGPVYIVQPGDTLWSIAVRFNISLDDLMNANNLTDSNLAAGQQLIIPGLEGLTGFLNTEVVGFGDSLRGLARRNQVSVSLLQRLNHIISPSELYVGVSLIVPQQEGVSKLPGSANLSKGETLLELAVRQNSDPWTLSSLNNLGGSWEALPGDSLYSISGTNNLNASGLPAAFLSAEVKSLPLKQGGTAEIIVKPASGATLSGFVVDRSLQFFDMGDGQQVALQGIHALLEPGVYPLHLDATLPDGSIQSYEQMVLVASGNYPLTSLYVDPVTLDPTVTEPENQKILDLVTPVNPQKYWQGPFILPVDAQYCIKDWFGGRRSYNGGLYSGFHSGVDYGICSEAKPYDIYAPASGVVIMSEKLIVRGNATIIDHGQGIYSGFWHQEESYVSVGELVTAGQLIGKIGGTGRVTGPHLHWELWVNGIQVDPLDWLDVLIP